ncbi:hypothetical protein [Nonomuraea zeae]|uniref:GAF domain-containing protein n=1 Tax=Nonomuraea zeae TaxID=1642303 RepID=A0A5S4GQJ0_9ACTN|nr:hypothetical protein [Nonomuraea zeae]TMR35225.1 hypothetical protein ETD85_14625 [Nonomuraea zeae]
MTTRRRRLAIRQLFEKWLLNLPASLTLALATPLLGVATGIVTGTVRGYLIGLLCCCTTLAGLSAWLRQSQAGEYKDAAQRMAKTLSGGGLPVLLELGRICRLEPGSAVGQIDSLVRNVLTTARQMCGYVKNRDEVHAAYYVADQKDLLRLFRDTWSMTGRSSPRLEIGMGGPRDHNFAHFASNTYDPPMQVLIEDDIKNSESPLGTLFVGNNTYRSSMAATVGLGSNSDAARWGVLVVTSPEKFAFGKSDGETLRLLAGVLAAGLAHAHQV